MGLVDDDRVVAAQEWVALRLSQQDAVGHQLDAGAGREPVLKPHLEADHLAQRCIQLLRNPLGHARCSDPPRLCVADELAAPG